MKIMNRIPSYPSAEKAVLIGISIALILYLVIFSLIFKTHKMNTEKVYNFKNSFLQININQFGLGFSIEKSGISIIILFLYIGYHSKN